MNCRAFIGYSRQILELPQAQSAEDPAEKFALELRASIPPALPPGSADTANLEVISERVVVIGLPDVALRANWILETNFGVSAGAKRRGPGGEICSRGSVRHAVAVTGFRPRR